MLACLKEINDLYSFPPNKENKHDFRKRHSLLMTICEERFTFIKKTCILKRNSKIAMLFKKLIISMRKDLIQFRKAIFIRKLIMLIRTVFGFDRSICIVKLYMELFKLTAK